MTLITPEELRDYLIANGVDESELQDLSLLQKFIDLKKEEIIALTGLPISPVFRKEFRKQFKGTLFETNWYPISEICNFKVDDIVLNDEDYVLDEDNGIIFLNKNLKGFLVIEYVHKVSSEFITSKINPLISSMVLYHIDESENSFGEISSIHEMDTSISYDTSNSLGNRIYAMINSLKTNNGYSARIRWL